MLANLRALFGVVVDIILLRRGPESLPASNTLLGIVVAVYLALYMPVQRVFLLSQLPAVPDSWPLQLILAALIELLWFRLAFQLARKPERFVQTATAVFATSAFFIPLVPMVGALIPYVEKRATGEAPPMLSFLTAFAALWMLAMLGRIVRVAFEWPWVPSILFVIAANLLPGLILSIFFGNSPKPV